GLRHPERPRVHADEEDALAGVGESPHVALVAAARVVERVVDVAGRRPEGGPAPAPAQAAGGGEELCRHAFSPPILPPWRRVAGTPASGFRLEFCRRSPAFEAVFPGES